MTTTYQIRLDEKLKENFLKVSNEKGLDGSMLIRYFMQSFTAKPEIVNFYIEDHFFKGLLEDKEIKSKLNKISTKLDSLGF